MNRDELLKRCVDRRVAHETSVVAVSHLFYVYLLSALKKGQRIEVPKFGTFGTHVVGVKRQRRMPYFEVDEELANRVNERYRNLKTLIVGRYEMIPVEGEVEYTGKEPKHDRLVETVGEEIILDTNRDITLEEYRREEYEREEASRTQPTTPAAAPRAEPPPVVEPRAEQLPASIEATAPPSEPHEPEFAAPTKERTLMPRQGFDLRDEGTEEPTQPYGEPREPQPTLREISGGEGPSAWVQILLGFIILAIITFALNQFGVIHLWGRRTPPPAETLPPPQERATITQGEEKPAEPVTPTPTPTPTEEPSTKAEVKKPLAETPKAETKVEPRPEKVQPPQPAEKAPTAPPAGEGRYTVQVSSWTSPEEADRAVARLKNAGFEAYVVEAFVKGRTWYRVRVGRFATTAEAQEAASKLRALNENGVWVAKVE
ncbi:MAG: hypothetical protein C4326_11800 [Ignavibacteria bacterium]